MAKQTTIKFDNEIRLMAKRANQRLVELEKRGMKTPAYQSAQAVLQMLGRGKNKKLRFSETGKGTANELARQRKFLNRFLNQETSTLKGAKKVRKKIQETVERKYNLSEHGITFDEYLEIFDEMSGEEMNRLFGSEMIIDIVTSVLSGRNEQEYSIKEIIDVIKKSKNINEALGKLNLTYEDLNADDLGEL